MKTNRTLKLITLTAAIFGFAATSFGQNTATAIAGSSAYIYSALSINKETDLRFGNIASGSESSEISVAATPEGARNVVTGDAMLPNVTGDFGAASFTIKGETGASITVTVPEADDEITLAGPGGNLTVTDFISSVSGSTTIDGGSFVLYIGGSITVPSGTTGGSYSVANGISVKVDYN